MKKTICLLLATTLLLSLLSCGKQEVPATDVPDVTEIGTLSADASTYPKATVPVYTEESTAQETEPDIQTEESTVQEMVYPPYEDKFTSFMEIPDRETFVNKRLTIIPEERGPHTSPLAIFRVVGIVDEYYKYNTLYQIQFVDFYGVDTFDSKGVYVMDELGHVDEQIYGRPPLEIGELYARLWMYDIPGYDAPVGERDTPFFGGIIYKVEEENGKRYLYPYCFDLSQLECSIKITDPEENCPYKKGKHDKAIAYLKEHNIPLPTYEYKVEAGEYYAECKRRCP